MSLEGYRVLITAGAQGIGLAIAKAFVKNGATVHVCDLDEQAISKLAPLGIKGSIANVANPNQLNAWLDNAINAMGGVDVLVNNAGIAGPTARVEDIELADWDMCMRVGITTQYLCAAKIVPIMKAQKSGSIINISSTAGQFGYPLRTPYAAAKWAVIGFTKSLAAEVGPWNIRVNAICPGAVAGPRMERVIAAEAENSGRTIEEVTKNYTADVSLRRFVESSEIADMAVFLASPQAKMVSGQEIAVDGHTETFHSS